MRAVYRYEVPVDDQWHAVELYEESLHGNPILHVASRDPAVVEFWAEYRTWDDQPDTNTRWFRVYGTGQPISEGPVEHRGSVIAADGQLVWHLYESLGKP
jgi:hypothetical protein